MIEVELKDHLGSDLSVVNAARVSFAKEHAEFDGEKDAKLIRFLAKHKHTSPFGHAFATFHVQAPVFVARQLVKHKFLRWNEVSRRYVKSAPQFYQPSWRWAASDKKQGSAGDMPDTQAAAIDVLFDRTCQFAKHAYERMLEVGVCEEQARTALPQATMTEWWWSGSLDAFADMCNLRCKPDAQAETREVADHIDKIMAGYFPVSWEALRSQDGGIEQLLTENADLREELAEAMARIEALEQQLDG